jgi:hypothetical protein
MLRPLSKLLELVGRLRLPQPRWRTEFALGPAEATDSRGGIGYRDFLSAEKLHDLWGPVPGAAYAPFHCVTLFAALDRVADAVRSSLTPVPAPPPPGFLAPNAPAPPWAQRDTLVLVDLPGPSAVSVGLYLATVGHQPVCTFDTWPHKKAAIAVERTLGALLYFAVEMSEARARLSPTSPPVWLCDRDRFAAAAPKPGRFDNRYCLEDRLLPGPSFLRERGITRVVYVAPDATSKELQDLSGYLGDLKTTGFELARTSIESEAAFLSPVPLTPEPAVTAGATLLRFARSSAGGFGAFVPEPSASGG